MLTIAYILQKRDVSVSFRKVQIFHFVSFHFVSQSTDFSFRFIPFHFAKYRFFISFRPISFRKVQIFHFVSFHFVSFHFVLFHFVLFHFVSPHFVSQSTISHFSYHERSFLGYSKKNLQFQKKSDEESMRANWQPL